MIVHTVYGVTIVPAWPWEPGAKPLFGEWLAAYRQIERTTAMSADHQWTGKRSFVTCKRCGDTTNLNGGEITIQFGTEAPITLGHIGPCNPARGEWRKSG